MPSKQPKKPDAKEIEIQNDFATKKYQDQMRESQGEQTPVKATDRMAPQYSSYADGRKPNSGSK